MIARLRTRRNERGAVLMMTALFTSMLLIAASFAVDLGGRAQQKRNDHLVADLAALDGVRVLTGANTSTVNSAVWASAARNGFPINTSTGAVTKSGYALATQLGNWGWSATDALYEFTPAATCSSCNAVKVTISSPYQDLFQAKNPQATLSASSIATNQNNAPIGQFQIGSTLATLTVSPNQVTLLNNLLSPFGVTSTMDILGYQGLATGSMTLGALASQLGLSALTPDQVLGSNIKVSQLIQAETNLLPAPAACGSVASQACAATQLTALNGLISGTTYNSSHTVNIGSLLGISTGTGAGFGTIVNMGQALQGALELANGTNAVALGLSSVGLSIPGLTNVSVSAAATAISPPGASPRGTPPQSAHDTQVTITLTATANLSISVLGLIGINVVGITLPIAITVGSASASMTAITCPTLPATTPTSMTIGPVAFQNLSESISGSVAVLSGSALGSGATIAAATTSNSPGSSASSTLGYTTNFYPGGNTPVTVTGTDSLPLSPSVSFTGSYGLFSTLNLLGGVTSGVTSLLSGVLSSASIVGSNGLLTNALSLFGVKIGSASLLGLYAQCAFPEVVN